MKNNIKIIIVILLCFISGIFIGNLNLIIFVSKSPIEVKNNQHETTEVEKTMQVKILDELAKSNFLVAKSSGIVKIDITYPSNSKGQFLNNESVIKTSYSHDRKKFVSIINNEPDTEVVFYNRNNNEKIERVAFSGPSGTWNDVFWLDDYRFALIGVREEILNSNMERIKVKTLSIYTVENNDILRKSYIQNVRD